MTVIYAHRGASGYAPENTFAAFDAAFSYRIDGIETDLRATRDGAVVLLHDASVDRTTDGVGPVAELTLPEVQALDAGAWFAPRFAGQRIPTLAAFLDRYGSRSRFWLELKAPGVEEQAARLVQERGLDDRVQFTSFNFASLQTMRRVWPAAGLAFLTREFPPDLIDRCRGIGIAQVSVHHATITSEIIRELREHGMDARSWGISDRPTLRRLLDLRVYGLTLNWPDWASEA